MVAALLVLKVCVLLELIFLSRITSTCASDSNSTFDLQSIDFGINATQGECHIMRLPPCLLKVCYFTAGTVLFLFNISFLNNNKFLFQDTQWYMMATKKWWMSPNPPLNLTRKIHLSRSYGAQSSILLDIKRIEK